ncbi:hypothetical protein BJX61DRAFT_551898 [Aspergillus egyptiacus]|nr:hypothetical protein BJX61DRAFT_551898 [Aspergillus egyptiacus]
MRAQSILSLAGLSSSVEKPDSNVLSLFTFGDSYTTTGFNASSTQPSLGNPMENPRLGSGTAADSINWVGYLATVYNSTPVLSYNHAVYGATVDNSIAPNVPGDLVHQVSHSFEPHYCGSGSGSNPIWAPDAALFSLWFGINDIYRVYLEPNASDKVAFVMESYFRLVDKLYDCGARDFLIMNVPPVDRSPKILQLEAWKRPLFKKVLDEFNAQLAAAVMRWTSAHPESEMALYDTWSFMTEVLDCPQEYGFLDSTCVGEGCIWWDRLHPRSAFHQILASDVAVFLQRRD